MKRIFKIALLFLLFAPKVYGENQEPVVEGVDLNDAESVVEEISPDTVNAQETKETKNTVVISSETVNAQETISRNEKLYRRLEQKLKSENWKERNAAVISIPDEDVEDKVDLIRIVLTGDKKYNVRIAAVKALIKIGSSQVIPPLTEALKDDKEYIRSCALAGLIDIGEEAADSIGSALKDSDEKIRRIAVDAIKVMKRSVALKYLDAALIDLSDDIREIAINGIYNIYGSTPGGFNGPYIVRLLGKSIDDEKRELRIKSLEYISSIGGPEAIELLYKGMEHSDSETRMKVVKSLGKIGGDQVVQPLAKALTDNNLKIRMEGLNTLSKIRTPGSLKVLASAITDRDYQIRKEVVKLLAESGNDTVVKELALALSDKSWDIRLFAVYTLGAIGNHEAVDKLCKAIRDRDKEVQSAAIKMLKLLKAKRSLNKLGKFLLSDKNFRKETAEALGEINDRRALKYLLMVLPEEKDEAKKAIEDAIIKIIKGSHDN